MAVGTNFYAPYIPTGISPLTKWARDLDTITEHQISKDHNNTYEDLRKAVEPIFKSKYPGNFSIYRNFGVDDELRSWFWKLKFDTPSDKTFWLLQHLEKT